MSKVYDITIIGAGPAGANLARLVGQGYKVLLIDKRNLNESNYKAAKCCGGLLAPDSQKMIASLGLGIPKDILVDPQLFAVRTIDLSADMERLWGVGRLRMLVSEFLRLKFDAQAEKLNAAIVDGNADFVAVQAEGMRRAWLYLDKVARGGRSVNGLGPIFSAAC